MATMENEMPKNVVTLNLEAQALNAISVVSCSDFFATSMLSLTPRFSEVSRVTPDLANRFNGFRVGRPAFKPILRKPLKRLVLVQLLNTPLKQGANRNDLREAGHTRHASVYFA
jgi:hypothetical protein